MIDLFSGMGGLLQALLDSGMKPLLGTDVYHMMFETDARCRQLLSHHHSHSGVWLSHLPDSNGDVGSVWVLAEQLASFINFLLKFSALESVLVGGGSPCVGFSFARINPQGMRDPESRKICIFPFILSRLRAALPLHVKIVFMMENVPMNSKPSDIQQRDAISRTMGVAPQCLKASLLLAAERERCYWTNLRPGHLPAISVDAASILEPGWRPLWELPSGRPAMDMRFATFCRGFGTGYPSEVADEHKTFPRLSLHSYSRRGLVYRVNLSADDQNLLTEKVAQGVDGVQGRKALRHKGSKSVLCRGDLAKWIHVHGGFDLLRPLCGAERDRALGFPTGASSLPDDEGSIFCLDHMLATGNSFAVPIVQHVLAPWTSWVLGGRTLDIDPGFPSISTLDGVLASLTPASGGVARQS